MAEYAYGDSDYDLPVARFALVSGTWTASWYHQDSLGSSLALSDSQGQVTEQYRYDLSGKAYLLFPKSSKDQTLVWKALASAPRSGNTKLFTGRDWDAQTNTYWYRARTYGPSLGRFLQRDPLGYADGANPYQYAHGSPWAYTDPTGMIAPLVAGMWFLGAWMFGTSASKSIESHWEHQAYVSSGTAGSEADEAAISRRNWEGFWAGTVVVGEAFAAARFIAGGTKTAVEIAQGASAASKAADAFEGAVGTIRASVGRAAQRALSATEREAAEIMADLASPGMRGGENVVYLSKNAAKEVQYVGITNNLTRRAAQHLANKGIRIQSILKGLSRYDARAVEQTLIRYHGLPKDGGTLMNLINSISPKRAIYESAISRGTEILKSINYF